MTEPKEGIKLKLYGLVPIGSNTILLTIASDDCAALAELKPITK